MATINAVLFDWGGTITPWHVVDLLEIWSAAASILAPEQADELAAALVAAESELWLQTSSSMASFTTDQLMRHAVAAVGLEVDEATYAAATEVYRLGWLPHTAAGPGALEMMRALRERGLRTGLLSNTNWPRAWHDDFLADDGLLELLDATVYTSELSHMKPHPSAFQTLLDAVGTTGEQAVFVGDRLHDDVSGAKALGMRTVWIRNEFVPAYDVQSDAVIDDLSELVDVVDGFLRQN
ncbi:MAG TPA: HAD family hydrolase [Mycobacteriales bacterium]|jgi:putative hydrolase of the HAD superfamily|nr:HAD family hydrolase [Mycobacteriales bacterium]